MKHLLYTMSIMLLFGITANAQVDWNTTGNFSAPNEVLGTNNNFPLNVRTNSIQRVKLNPDVSYAVNGYTGLRNGNLLLGYSQGYASGIFSSASEGAYSLLHLNGPNGTFVQSGGYRPWMQTGVTFTDNDDLSYMGMRKVGAGTDITETVIVWSDNGDNGFPGPDDMVFRFTSGGLGNTQISSDLTDPTDLDGLHVARFTGNGNMGLGPTFGTDNALYVRPQSLLHMSRDGKKQTWLQITNQSGTGQTVDDGLRIGILPNRTALIRQQENSPLIIQSDWNSGAGGIYNGERMRISSIGSFGVPHPAGAPNNNITRVAISEEGSSPITEPRSLLHLGYNVGLSILNSVDGWRDWMDVGTFTNQGTDNLYVGMKKEDGNSPLGDRYDAVISWGDNQGPFGPLNVGPDNLRFIFTSTVDLGAGDPVSTGNNGLEVGRFSPALATTLPASNYGMMGIGNFAPGSMNDVNGLPVDAKLDIDGDLRIRQVTRVDTLNAVLVIDTNDLNRVHWRDISSLGGGVGNYCPDPQNPLTDNFEVPLDSFNYYFTGSQPFQGTGFAPTSVGVGVPCGTGLMGKLHVHQQEIDYNDVNPVSIAGYFNNNTSVNVVESYGIFSLADGVTLLHNTGGEFQARNAGKQNIGVEGVASGSSGQTYGGRFIASGSSPNYGIWAQAPTGPSDWAGYFSGNVYTTGTYQGSDEMLKENIEDLHDASDIIAELRPVDFDFRADEYPSMNLPGEHQMGVIAQEVQEVLPELVKVSVCPAVYDSLGNEAHPEVDFLSVNYEQFIPLLIAGFQEQTARLAERDSAVHSLQERLAALESCVNAAHLCDSPSLRMDGSGPQGQTVELENPDAIILDQNVPNPFAERTDIDYLIPEHVQKAVLLFYDQNGRIINQVQIRDRGNGSLTVYGQNLMNGVYTYSLIADGKLITTKKMVKQ